MSSRKNPIKEGRGEKPDTKKPKMREFKGGGSRDSVEGKYDFEGFLSPIVLEAYAKFMNHHRKQADGKLRASDNWQKHFGEDHFGVCIKSLWRHFMDLWFLHRGYKRTDAKDNHTITKEEALMAILFNTMAYADKLLKDDKEVKNVSEESNETVVIDGIPYIKYGGSLHLKKE